MLLPIEPQKEPIFQWPSFTFARGTQSAVFPTLSGACTGSLQGGTAEGVSEKNRALFEVDEYLRIPHMSNTFMTLKNTRSDHFSMWEDKQKPAYNNQK